MRYLQLIFIFLSRFLIEKILPIRPLLFEILCSFNFLLRWPKGSLLSSRLNCIQATKMSLYFLHSKYCHSLNLTAQRSIYYGYEVSVNQSLNCAVSLCSTTFFVVILVCHDFYKVQTPNRLSRQISANNRLKFGYIILNQLVE